MMGRLVIIVLLGLLELGYAAKCPRQRTSPGREIVCYTSTFDVKHLENTICKCTTLIHQGHDIQTLTTTGLDNLRKSLKDINPVLQFVVSINDARGTLKTSANARQEAVARIVNIFNEVDGVELNVTAGTKERLVHFVQGLKDEMTRKSKERRIIVQLPTKAEELAKQFDVKGLSKFVDLFTIPTHYLMNNDNKYKTFHPSRLMGLFDLLNTDSLVDLVHGLGAAKRKILVSLPASGYKFTLKIKDENAAGDDTQEEIPVRINRQELCDSILEGEWTIERDEDLTAPYAFKDNTWIAFEDKISAGIKGKYVLLRDLAGVAINDVDDDSTTNCGTTLTEHIYHSFTDNKRKSREAVLTSLQDDIYNMEASYPGNLKSSDFRISRIVDVDGKIHSVRENIQTEFSCSRQGYFVHPKSCNRFYRCVKFNQEVENYSVFEFDCPAGLAFDERTEVCVWPGSLPEGSPCPGSPEIAPTAPRRFKCPGHGYFADPQNCRWFFACIDLGGEKMMAYEFQCPYGLVFDEQKLVCEWPWLVPDCAGKNYEHHGGSGSDGHGGYGGNGGHGGDGGYGEHDGKGKDGHGGHEKPEYGGHGMPEHGGHDGGHEKPEHEGHEGGHGGYDYPTKGGHGGHEKPEHGGHGMPEHGGHDGGHEKPEHGSHGMPEYGGHDGGHGGYDYPTKGGHGGHEKPEHGGHGMPEHGGHDGGHSGHEKPEHGSHGMPEHGGHDGGHGGYDYPTKGGHGGHEIPEHDGHEGGHDKPEYGSPEKPEYFGHEIPEHGGHDGGHGMQEHGGHDDGSHGGPGKHDYPTKGGHSGHEIPQHGGHEGGHEIPEHGGHDGGSHGGHEKPEHGGHEIPEHGGQDGVSHGGHEESGHGGYDDGSSHDEHGGYDEPKEGEHNGGAHGGQEESGHGGYDDGSYDGHGGYDQSSEGGYDGESSHGSHGGHEEESKKGDNGEYDQTNKGGDEGMYSHDSTGDQENTEYAGYDESNSGGSYDEHGGQTEDGGYGEKTIGGYDESNNSGHDDSSSHGEHENHNTETHVTGNEHEQQVEHGKYSADGHATSSYTTGTGHFSISHNGFTPSDGRQYTTGGAYSKGYPGPPTIILGSEGSHYTTGGQTYSGSSGDQTAGHFTGGYYTGGKVNSGYTSSTGNAHGGFGTKTTGADSSSSIYRGNAGAPGDLHRGTTSHNFGNVQTSSGTSGVLTNGVNHDGSIISGISHPGYIQAQPGASGYVVTNGVKTIYDGTAVPQAPLHDTASSGLAIGQTGSGQIFHGPTTSGIYFGSSAPSSDSVINMGNGYYTNQAGGSYSGNIGSKGGAGFTSSGSAISPGNQYYTNQAGTSYRGVAGTRGHVGAPISSTSVTTSGNNYYNNQPGYNQNIGSSRGTPFTPAVSEISSGNRYYTNQAGISSSDNNQEIPIKSTVAGAYETNEYHDNGGRGTIRYNNGVVTHKYTEDDVRDHRTSFRIPPSTEVTRSDTFTPVPEGTYTRGGFTKTGPTKTGITTAQLGGTGTYVAEVKTIRPITNTDNIGENAFGTVNRQNSIIKKPQQETITYSYQQSIKFDNTDVTESPNVYHNSLPSSQSPFFNVHVYNTPTVLPSAPITASPTVVNTYSYANPTSVQYQENTYQSSKSSSNSASAGVYSNPFLTAQRKYPTVSPTVEPIGYTTAPLDNYRSTAYQAARIPVDVSTVQPIVDNGYKTVISSTPISVPVENGNYDYNESGGLTNSGKTSRDQYSNVGVSFQQSSTAIPLPTISSGYFHRPTTQNYNQRVTSSVSYQQSANGDSDAKETPDYTYHRTNGGFGQKTNQGGTFTKGSIAYQQPTVTIQPQVYRRPSPIAPYQPGENYAQSTSPENNAGNGYKYPTPNKELIKSSTPKISYSTVRPTEADVSPANPSINRNEVVKLVTNYNNRGSVKYTPAGYGSTTSNKFDSNESIDQKATSYGGFTTPQPRVTTYSGGYGRISTTPTYEENKSTEIARVKNNGKVVVKFSDLHPILLGKLGAECTCKADPFASFKGNKPLIIDSSKGQVDLRNYDESDVYVDLENSREAELQDYNDYNNYKSSTPLSRISTYETPVIAVFNGIKSAKSQIQQPSPTYLPASTPCPPSTNYLPSTTSSPLRVSASDIEASASYSSGTIRSRSGKSLGTSRGNTLPTFDTSLDRMDSDEIGVLEMSAEGEAECARPGLFRHPKFCNKFYVCHWDEWKKKFSLHIFNCPIHLTFDNRAGACNWPSKGPACQDNNILV